jgi:ubiquitin C-terminal hydrolase
MTTTVSSNARYQDTVDKKVHKNLVDLSDGIVGIRNISFYCYLNAFVQCLIPIDEMRDHYLT